MRRRSVSCLCAAMVFVSAVGVVSGQAGNIVPGEQHAWAENAGWSDFRPASGGVTVEAGWLSGYAWAENLGWVKLGAAAGGPYANTTASNWGVNRDLAGNLSGWAWAENAGWIHFSPAGGGVTVDAPGRLSGFAWSENVGWVSFRGSGAGGAYGVAMQGASIPAVAGLGLLALTGGLGALGVWGLRRRARHGAGCVA